MCLRRVVPNTGQSQKPAKRQSVCRLRPKLHECLMIHNSIILNRFGIQEEKWRPLACKRLPRECLASWWATRSTASRVRRPKPAVRTGALRPRPHWSAASARSATSRPTKSPSMIRFTVLVRSPGSKFNQATPFRSSRSGSLYKSAQGGAESIHCRATWPRTYLHHGARGSRSSREARRLAVLLQIQTGGHEAGANWHARNQGFNAAKNMDLGIDQRRLAPPRPLQVVLQPGTTLPNVPSGPEKQPISHPGAKYGQN